MAKPSILLLLLCTGRVPLDATASVGVFQANDSQSGLRLLRRAQDAMGGAERLAAVRDTTHVMEIALEPSAGGYKLTQTSKYIRPSHFRQEQETPFGRIVAYSDGRSGWVATPQGVAPASAEVLATVRGVLFRQPTALMLSDRDPERSVRWVRDNVVEISSADGLLVEIEFSPDTGLPLQQSYVVDAADGSRATRTETFADWRDVDGVRFPFRATQFENGSKVLEVRVSEYQINVGFTSSELDSQ